MEYGHISSMVSRVIANTAAAITQRQNSSDALID
ncbi:uncharacterized protein G2W53_042208 [Senna tora]|uniref:Uncharacterized protein n=1 Tax=Senna tora TaxID=362788 RepID=A0A834SGN4_9FABA|nr:uncharacterized protein G2W53_042208 [Senna tora]